MTGTTRLLSGIIQRDADEDLPPGQQVEKCVQASDYVIWNEDELRLWTSAKSG